MRNAGFAALLVALTLQTSLPQQAVLTPVKDNTLYQTADGSTSNGAGEFLFVGRTNAASLRRALIKFDIAGVVPAGATITSVSLRLNMSKTASGIQTIALKKVSADWGEGTSNAADPDGQGAPSTTGDATWIHRFKGTSNWTTAGGDFVTTESASLSVNAIGTYSWTSTPQLVADVQGWLTNPSSNFGWIITGNEAIDKTAKRFDSRENATTANRPQLTVNYTTSTSVAINGTAPVDFGLIGNYPNPFNPSTRVEFALPGEEHARLSVYNLLGIRVATLVDGRTTAGRHAVTWDATGMPTGMYFAVLEAGRMRSMKRMVLAK